MKKIFLILFLLYAYRNYATHNQGGKIEIAWMTALTYEITITTYTKTSSIQADRPVLDTVSIGGVILPFSRNSKINLPGDLSVNEYKRIYSFPDQGRYKVHVIDPNRNTDLVNIPNSVSVPFCVESEVVVFDPAYYCTASTPVYNLPPLVHAYINKELIYNPTAYDVDRDSLVFSLVPCLGANALPIPGYVIPAGISINSHTGEMRWNNTTLGMDGVYAFCIKSEKFRRGINVGYTTLDFQFELSATPDTTFGFKNLSTYPIHPDNYYFSSVNAGDTFNLSVAYYDSSLQATLFFTSPITMNVADSSSVSGHETTSYVSWVGDPAFINPHPYILSFTNHTFSLCLTYLLYVNGNFTDTCPNFPAISVDEINNEIDFEIFPNPSTGSVTISLPRKQNSFSIIVSDVTGREISCLKNVTDESLTISTANFSPGVYFITVRSMHSSASRKFLVSGY
jgi:hypothetical protein